MAPSAVLATGTGEAPKRWASEHLSAAGLAASGPDDKAANPNDAISTARAAAISFCAMGGADPVNCRPSLGAPPSSPPRYPPVNRLENAPANSRKSRVSVEGGADLGAGFGEGVGVGWVGERVAEGI